MKRLREFLLLAALKLHVLAQDIPIPIEFTPSGFWDGNDGPWSTFSLSVGTPPQVIRVIPSIAQNILTVVRPEDCVTELYGFQNCSDSRGGVFRKSESTTWIDEGDNDVDPMGNGLFKRTLTFGLDTVGIGSKPQASKMKNQTIGLMHSPGSSYIGVVGISPVPVNWTEDHTVKETFFDGLKASTRIASRTVAYTAGAWSRKLFGSLILGGYDASRMADSTPPLSVPFTNDRIRALSIGVKDITFTDTVNPNPHAPNRILEDPMILPIDPYISRLWLPQKVCNQFEKALNLSWDVKERLYYITEEQHRDFIARNTSFTFTITDPLFRGGSIQIQIPYDLLALNAIHPLTEKPGRYFPIQPPTLPDQIVLGRAFLQAAYIIADFDRGILNISQAKLEEVSESRVFIIPPPSNTTLGSGKTVDGQGTRKSSLSGGTIGGIIVLSLAVLLILILFIRRHVRQRQEREQKYKEEQQRFQQEQPQRDLEAGMGLVSARPNELGRSISRHEAGAPTTPRVELNANDNMLVEKDDSRRTELEATVPRQALASNLEQNEFDGDRPLLELEGSPVSNRDANRARPPAELGKSTDRRRNQEEDDVISKVIDNEMERGQPDLRLET